MATVRNPQRPMVFRLLSFCQCALLAACSALASTPTRVPLSERVTNGERFMGIRLLGTLRLPTEFDGVTVGGISGLAWDRDESLLYAISDKGELHHFQPLFEDGLLSDIRHLGSFALQDAQSRPLRPPWADSEGLTLVNADNGISGDSELLVSFEIRMRIRRYTNTGKRLGGIELPQALRNPERYININIALEAITTHPRWEILVAPERTLRGDPKGLLTLFSTTGRSWIYPLADAPKSSLVAMQTLDDGSVLFLERAFTSVMQPLIISLRRAELPESSTAPLSVQDIAVLDSSKGWLLDNFEGLAHHGNGRFFMVSDDNQHFLQNTLLVFFELTSPDSIRP